MWVNISQAAKLTGYKYGEIRRLIAKGAFPFYHNGNRRSILKEPRQGRGSGG